jgi:hypothetical protein
MKKWSICSLAVILTVLTTNSAIAQSLTLLKTTLLADYPSASGVQFYNGKLYIIGDDATHLLVLTTEHLPSDSVTLFKQTEKRIHYSIKPDLESLTIGQYKGSDYLLAIPSFSSEKRNTIYVFPTSKIESYKAVSTSTPIHQLKKLGIREPNLEGAAFTKKKLIVSNRANLSQPVNYLVIIPIKKRSLQNSKNWKKTAITLNKSNQTIGISDLAYWAKKDMLLFTASTEATTSATADGTIGESYLGYFSHFSDKSVNTSITPDNLINLSKELKIGNQKIEGICVENYTGNIMTLHLVADNDDGQSILYKVQMTF